MPGILRDRNGQATQAKCHRADSDGIGKHHSIHRKEGWLVPCLCRLRNVERNNCPRIWSVTTYGRVKWLLQWGNYPLVTWRELRLLENWNWPRGPRERCVHELSWHFQMTGIPVALCNAPAAFERAMAVLLSSVNWKLALVYIVDLLVFLNNIKNHISHLWKVPTGLEYRNVIHELKRVPSR